MRHGKQGSAKAVVGARIDELLGTEAEPGRASDEVSYDEYGLVRVVETSRGRLEKKMNRRGLHMGNLSRARESWRPGRWCRGSVVTRG